jgi:hypothetical protein
MVEKGEKIKQPMNEFGNFDMGDDFRIFGIRKVRNIMSAT